MDVVALFDFRIVAYAPNGGRLGVVDASEVQAAPVVDDVPGLSVTFVEGCRGWQHVKDCRPVEFALEVWDHRKRAWVEGESSRFLALRPKEDATNTPRTVSVNATGYGFVLRRSAIPAPNKPYIPPKKNKNDGNQQKDWRWHLGPSTPGKVLRTFIDACKRDGMLPGLSMRFTDSKDANGKPWTVTDFDMPVAPGTKLDSVLESLTSTGAVSWWFEGRTLCVSNDGGEGRDLTDVASPVGLRLGVEVGDAPSESDWSDLVHAFTVHGENGKRWVVNQSAGTPAPWGKFTESMSASNVSDEKTARYLASGQLRAGSDVQAQHTRKLLFHDDALVLPFVDYAPGDWVFAPGKGGRRERLQVRQVTLTRRSGELSGSVVLGDRLMVASRKIARRLRAVEDGTPGGAADTDKPVVEVDDREPEPPLTLSGTVEEYYDVLGNARARVRYSWPIVNTDASGDFLRTHHYEGWRVIKRQVGEPGGGNGDSGVEGQESGGPGSESEAGAYEPVAVERLFTTSNNEWVWDPFPVNETIEVFVTAHAANGMVSRSSPSVTNLWEGDRTPPGVPTGPKPIAHPGSVEFVWDGLFVGGEGAPPDFARLDVWIADSADGEKRRAGTILGAGGALVVPNAVAATTWAWFRAVDSSGNESGWSASSFAASEPFVDKAALIREIEDPIKQAVETSLEGVESRLGQAERAARAAAEEAASALAEAQAAADNALAATEGVTRTRQDLEDHARRLGEQAEELAQRAADIARVDGVLTEQALEYQRQAEALREQAAQLSKQADDLKAAKDAVVVLQAARAEHAEKLLELDRLRERVAEAEQLANGAMVSANGKNKTHWGAKQPVDSYPPNATVGDVYYQLDNTGRISTVYERTPLGWQSRTLTHKSIDSVDIGSLVAVSAKMNSAVVNQLFAQVIKARSITAGHIDFNTFMGDQGWVNVLGSTRVTVSKSWGYYYNGEGQRVEITHAGLKLWHVADEGEPSISLSTDGDDAFTARDENNEVVASISSSGTVAGTTVAAARDVSVGNHIYVPPDFMPYRWQETSATIRGARGGHVPEPRLFDGVNMMPQGLVTWGQWHPGGLSHLSVGPGQTQSICEFDWYPRTALGDMDTYGGMSEYPEDDWSRMYLVQVHSTYWRTTHQTHTVLQLNATTDGSNPRPGNTGRWLASMARNVDGDHTHSISGIYGSNNGNRIRMLLQMTNAGSQGTVTHSALTPLYVTVTDLGASILPTARTRTDRMGGAVGGGSTSSTSRTTTYLYTGHRNFYASGAIYNSSTHDKYAVWGPQPHTPDGNIKSTVHFRPWGSDLSGAMVERVQVYVKTNHWYHNKGGRLYIGFTANQNPGDWNEVYYGAVQADFARGEGRWLTVPSKYYSAFKSGWIRGLSFRTPEGKQYYGYGTPNEFKVRITYRK